MKEGTKENPWKLKTPPLTSDYEMYRDTKGSKEVIVFLVGKTTLLYDNRSLNELNQMLKSHGDWMDLGSADEQKPTKGPQKKVLLKHGGDLPPILGGWY